MTADLLPDNLDDAAYWTEPESETSPSAARRTLHHGGQEADESETEERITKAPTAKRRAMRPKLTADLLCDGTRGLAYLHQNGPKIQYRGKGFEADDLHKFLMFYQQWSHELFPRLSFPEFVLKAEKVCRERRMKHYLSGLRVGSDGSQLSGETVGDVEGDVEFKGDGDARAVAASNTSDMEDDQPVFKRRVVDMNEDQDGDGGVFSDMEIENAVENKPDSVQPVSRPEVPEKSLEERMEENRIKALELLAKKQRERKAQRIQEDWDQEQERLNMDVELQKQAESTMDDEEALMDELNDTSKKDRPFWQPFSDDDEDLIPARNILRKDSQSSSIRLNPENVDVNMDGESSTAVNDVHGQEASAVNQMRRKRTVISDESD